jgi:hypothetical protein
MIIRIDDSDKLQVIKSANKNKIPIDPFIDDGSRILCKCGEDIKEFPQVSLVHYDKDPDDFDDDYPRDEQEDCWYYSRCSKCGREYQLSEDIFDVLVEYLKEE